MRMILRIMKSIGCNNLSYKYQNPIYHAEYWPNLDWRIAEREAMMELVNADLAE